MQIDFREMLEANRARADEVRSELAERQAHCIHRDDGLLSDWSETMPPKPAPPTVAEVGQMIRDAMVEQPHALTADEIERMIRSTIVEYNPATMECISILAEEIRRLRADAMAHPKPAEEFFYTDDNGVKQDAELHNAIINPIDFPIDERVMGPIRAKHRGRWLAEQRARRRG